MLGNIDYSVEFLGLDDPEIIEHLEQVSDLKKRKEQRPATLTALRHRANEDLHQMAKVLQGLGYYDAEITADFEEESDRMRVLLLIDPGVRYTLASFDVLSVIEREPPYEDMGSWPLQADAQVDLTLFSSEDLGVCLGEAAIAKTVLNAEERIVFLLSNEGYPYAVVHERAALADQATKELRVSVYVNSGPRLNFGSTTLLGLSTVNPWIVERRIAWNEGDLYSRKVVEETQKAILKTQLFGLVDIRMAPLEQLDNEYVDMEIELKESKHRTVGFGGGFQTNRGLGGNAIWEHRNLRGLGERLTARGALQKLHNLGELSYRKPDFLCLNQDMIAYLAGEYEQTESYTERELGIGLRIERTCGDCLSFWAGGALKQQRVREYAGPRTDHTLVSFPVGFRYTETDDLLNPTRGFTVLGRTTPFMSVSDTEVSWVSHELIVTAYYPLTCSPKLILAGKGHWAVLWGASRLDVPAPERIHAGSANNLRGYGYRSVSPLTSQRIPQGGRSLMTYSLEGRLRSTEDLELVTFFDIGNVYEEPFPQFSDKYLKSVGLGVRYHTPIGPLRADIAFPLDRRAGVDDGHEIYLSIGQAF